MEKNMWQNFEPTAVSTTIGNTVTNRQAALAAAVELAAMAKINGPSLNVEYIIRDAQKFLSFLEPDNG